MEWKETLYRKAAHRASVLSLDDDTAREVIHPSPPGVCAGQRTECSSVLAFCGDQWGFSATGQPRVPPTHTSARGHQRLLGRCLGRSQTIGQKVKMMEYPG